MGLRDQAREFEALNCRILGASFDTPEENKAFKEKFDFPFDLLCDTDRTVGEQYQAKRAAGHAYEGYPERISYLIDPDGVIRRAYAVEDPAGHASVVLDDLRRLQQS